MEEASWKSVGYKFAEAQKGKLGWMVAPCQAVEGGV